MSLAALLLGTASAAAPGDHIRAGEAVITPSLGLGFEYRSNAFRSETSPQGTGALRIAPGLDIVANTPQVSFSFNGRYALRKFLFLTNPLDVGQDQIRTQINRLDRFNAFNVSAELRALKDRQVSVRLSDTVLLQNNPNDSVPDADDPYATQFRNTLAGGIIARPGPALSFDVGGVWRHGTFFVPSALDQRDAFNTRNSYGPTLAVRYAFLPRTAWVLDSSFVWNNWVDENPTIGDLSFPTPDSRQFRARTGIQGRITERLRVVLKVGFGAAWYDEGPNLSPLNGLLVAAQGDYSLTEQHRATLGYRKSFVDSFFTNVAAHNTVYGRWTGKYGEKFSSRLQYAIRFEDYDGVVVQRNDIVNQLTATVQYTPRPWVNTSLSGGWLGRSSSDPIVEYNDIRVLASAEFSY